ncbi:MAG: HYR domain-containing protein [Psychroserpens sp.]|uniref:HYR domain-containing protein n=1 Tax=Psychroserpens sp. TaxID=2020870 RepID=UPI0030010352
MKKVTQFLTLLSTLLIMSSGYAQKVAIIGMNHNSSSPNTDGFSFVATEIIPNGEVIYFTENEYDAASDVFTFGIGTTGEGVVKFTATSEISAGTVIFVNETGTSTNIFTVSCTGGACGTAIIAPLGGSNGNGGFSLGTSGDGLYAYSDTNENVRDAIGVIYSVMYTEGGGTIPANESPISDFPNAIVVDGFPASNPDRTEFKFSPAALRDGVSQAGLKNPNNYLHAQTNQSLSIVQFTNINLVGADPLLTLTGTPATITENAAGTFTYTFTLGVTATSNLTVDFLVGGTATLNTDYTTSGANTFNMSSGSVIIPNGSTSISFTIDPTGDTDLEPDETIILTVIDGAGYDPDSPSSSTSTIANDDTDSTVPIVAVTGLNHVSTAPAVDGFSFVTLDDITGGITIYFTENKYNNTTLAFSGAEGVVSYITPAGGLTRGDVVVATETGTSTNVFNLTCNGNSGAACGTMTVVSGSFSIDTIGESFYAYSDTDINPNNGVTAIYSLLYTGESGGPSGGNVPAIQDPFSIYTNAVVIDGFINTPPNRTEYKFAGGERAIDVGLADFQNPSNWLHANANATLSPVPFNNIIITTGTVNPIATVAITPNSVAEDSGTGMVYTFSLSIAPTTDITIHYTVGGTATYPGDYVATGAGTFNAATGTVIIPNGSLSAAVTITPVTDSNVEPLETVILALASGTGYNGGSPNDATGSITNDDTSNSDPLVAITGMNHVTPDGFSFVAAKDIPAGTTIYFTENEFDNTSLMFTTGEGVFAYTSPGAVIPAGDVIVIKEIVSNVFSLTCNGASGAACGSIVLVSGNLAHDTLGESLYAYEDSDNDPSNGVDDIYAVMFTGLSGGPSGGTIPASQDPSGIYLSALVIDGFPASAPGRAEYRFAAAERDIPVGIADFENTAANWLYGLGNADLSPIPFANLTIVDTTPPVITCPADIVVDNDTGSCGAVVSFTVTATDNLPGVSVESTPASGSIFPVGTTTVTSVATDATGNTDSCTFDVTVNDNTAPSISCPGNQDETADANCDVSLPDYTNSATTADNCDGSPVVSQLPIPGTTISGAGTVQTVTLRSTDASGNWAECTFDVTVKDNTAPSISCPGNQDETADANCDVSLPDYTNSATTADNCDGSPVVSQLPIPGTTISGAGTVQTVTLRSTDASGNWAECTFDVTVKDNTAPSISCVGNQFKDTDLGQCDYTVLGTEFDPTGFDDNCPGSTIENDYDNTDSLDGSVFPVGTTTVVWTVTDASNNTKICTFDVTVGDDEDPTISCPADVVITSVPGECNTPVVLGTPTFNDNCPGTTVLNDAPASFPFGVTSVTWTATDVTGNTAQCVQMVTVNKINTITTLTVTPDTQQYSDEVTFEAIIDPGDCPGAGPAATKVLFKVGNQIMGTVNLVAVGGNLVGTLLAPLVEIPTYPSNGEMAPGVHVVSAEFQGVNTTNYNISNPPDVNLEITQEDALIDYTGQTLQATTSSSSSMATVSLCVNVQDINDGNRGDIRNATLTFVNRDLLNTDINYVIAGPIPMVDLVLPGDNTLGAICYDWMVNIGNAQSKSYTVGFIIDNYYTRDSSEDNTVITVYKPVGDFITGGGYIFPVASEGVYASTDGLKTNFGFNVKYNKKGKKLKGHMNIIFRRDVGGLIHTYQIKGNAIQSLGVNIADPDAKFGEFITKANLKDITDPLNPISLGGNLTLKVEMTDRGEPGIDDSIGINLTNNSNTLLYSSNWLGFSTEEMLLSGGNLVVHSGFSLARTFEVFEVNSWPNPSDTTFNIKLNSTNDELVDIVVFDITNKVIRKDRFNPKDVYEFGDKLQSGLYFVQISQGSHMEIMRLIKY